MADEADATDSPAPTRPVEPKPTKMVAFPRTAKVQVDVSNGDANTSSDVPEKLTTPDTSNDMFEKLTAHEEHVNSWRMNMMVLEPY